MYDIRQFKPTLYLVLMLGITGFCMAAETLGLWGVCFVAIALNAWLVRTGRFQPFPRWMANGVTVITVAYIALRIKADDAPPPLIHVGYFLAFLHLVKLYEQRANRDYAQLLVLSLLLMVAGAINSTSLGFALLMLVYLALSLYCCLLFHLKVEAELAREALDIPADKLSPSTLRQDQRFLPRSMRRLTIIVWLVSVGSATIVFLFFPRGAGAGLLGQLQLKSGTTLTGISDHLSFDQITRIKQSDDVVARIDVYKDNVPVEGGALYLRCSAFDIYAPDLGRGVSRKQWLRSESLSAPGVEVSERVRPFGPLLPAGVSVWRQHVILEPAGSKYLMALPGLMYHQQPGFGRIIAVKTGRVPVRDFPADDSIQIQSDALGSALDYEVLSTNSPPPARRGGRARGPANAALTTNAAVLSQIREYAVPLLPEDIAARLKASRSASPTPQERERIARLFEHHLRSEFSYSLDLTASKGLFRDRDPVVAFLTIVKKGHCEYFASAMTLMCQSINIPARLVQGFHCDEYNTFGAGHFIVKASQAHAWVEVLTPEGWTTFDPTSSRDAPSTPAAGLWGTLKHFIDYLEYKWVESVVAYDAGDRQEIVRSADAAAINLLVALREFVRGLGRITYTTAFWTASLSVLNVMIWVLGLCFFAAIVWYLTQRYRLRRRAARIGLEALPVARRIRLARQLAFYDHLMRLLYRLDIERPRHMTNLEFSNSLVYLPTRTYESIHRLTDLFYRVRFGGEQLPPARQRRLESIVALLGRTLFTHPPD